MPTLGFLKKKRTREANRDSTSSSQPTSPVTPSATKTFEQAFQDANKPAATKTLPAMSHPRAEAPQAGATPYQPSTGSDVPVTTYAANPAAAPVQQQPPQLAQVSAPVSTPSPGTTDTQHLPTISNLINPASAHTGGDAYQKAPGNPPTYAAAPAAGAQVQPPSQPQTHALPSLPQAQPPQQPPQQQVPQQAVYGHLFDDF
ncbi:hypothetical protein F503_08364 [Ophiostoma piceae UAMH 11346]|uniref:Uncharacterized protein n=1 Tax=Ophiostoma piceae (strain UAMH 11346) TaxID=1262450 RepID=S3CHL7_OPHP1|nr:hypothetical protein F503_08364 [Ophiostoma piceae UAMH 11346]